MHLISDSLKDNGLRVGVGLRLDLSQSLSLLGLIHFPFLLFLAHFGSTRWALNSSSFGHLLCCPLACTVTVRSSPCSLLSLLNPSTHTIHLSYFFLFSSHISSLFCCTEISASILFLKKGKASKVLPSSSCLSVWST